MEADILTTLCSGRTWHQKAKVVVVSLVDSLRYEDPEDWECERWYLKP